MPQGTSKDSGKSYYVWDVGIKNVMQSVMSVAFNLLTLSDIHLILGVKGAIYRHTKQAC